MFADIAKRPWIENHYVKAEIAASAITVLKKSMWDPEKSKNGAYPYNDPFRDVGRQQIGLVLVSSIQSDHQHEVSNSETADQCQHIRGQSHNLCNQIPPHS